MDLLQQSLDNVRNSKNSVTDGSTVNRCSAPKVLNKRTYPLNKSKCKWLDVGFSPDLPFPPVIQIFGLKNDWLMFDYAEWKQLIEKQTYILRFFSSPEKEAAPVHLTTKILTFTTLKVHDKERKVVAIHDQCGNAVYLGPESFYVLWNIVGLIDYRVEILTGLNFHQFYTSIIKGVGDIGGDVKTNIENVLLPVMQTHSENAYCMLEMLTFQEDVINADVELERIMMPQLLKTA